MILRADGRLLASDSIANELMAGSAELSGLRGLGVTFSFGGSSHEKREDPTSYIVGVTEAELGQLALSYIDSLSATEFAKSLAEAQTTRSRAAIEAPSVHSDLPFVAEDVAAAA